jgi:hypothetical protein
MSTPITVDIPHGLGRQEARRRIEAGFGRLEQQLLAGGLVRARTNWSGDSLSFSAQALGQALCGRLDVLDNRVHMEVELPLVLAMIADQVRGRLQREGQLLLEKK